MVEKGGPIEDPVAVHQDGGAVRACALNRESVRALAELYGIKRCEGAHGFEYIFWRVDEGGTVNG